METTIATMGSATDREIVLSRMIQAPRELVFRAFTNSQQMEMWWGPHGFTTSIQQMNATAGGSARFIMHGSDGIDYPNRFEYLDVQRPSQLVYVHGEFDVSPENDFLVTVTFEEVGFRTKLTMRSLFSSVEVCKQTKAFGAEELGHQTLDRLEEFLATKEFMIARVFDAPRELVYKAHTDPSLVGQWWGSTARDGGTSKGCSLPKYTLDLQPGGKFHYCMKTPEGFEMWGLFSYRTVEPMERLEYLVSFCDAEQKLLRHPMSATWPLETWNSMTLTEYKGKTTMTIVGGPYHASDEEWDTFLAGRESMHKGFAATYDQLTELLTKWTSLQPKETP